MFAQTFNHLDQFERAYVRMRRPQYFLGCAEIHKLLHHLATQMTRVFDLAIELAVGKRACAAFAELHIALGLEHRLAPQTPGVLRALAHRRAALNHNGFEPHLRQHQRGKHAARPEADHHRALAVNRTPIGRRLHRRAPHHVGRGLYVRIRGVLLQQLCFLCCTVQRDIDDVNHQQVLLARVETAFEH